MMIRFKNKENLLRNYFFQEWDKADKLSKGFPLNDSEIKRRSRIANSYNEGETKSIDGNKVNEKEKALFNLDSKLKIEVLQLLVALLKNSSLFSQWLKDPTNIGCDQYEENDNQKGYVGKYTQILHFVDNTLRREQQQWSNIQNSTKSQSQNLMSNLKVMNKHPLSKINLVNKVYFMTLLISRKIVPENLAKVIQYFQNYYPQSYDCAWSIWIFLFNNITDNLKRWMGNDSSSTSMAHDFFVRIWSEYEEKIIKRFQITKTTPTDQNNTSAENKNKIQMRKSGFSAGLQGGYTSVLSKNRNDNLRQGTNAKAKRSKPAQPVPIWRMKPPEDKDKSEWKEKVYKKYLEHICQTNGK